jgi:hypothetical protein
MSRPPTNHERSDALKRHWNSCSVRRARNSAIPTVKARARGRKTRACDLCCRLKKACNLSQPCALCASRNQVCEYSRPQKLGRDQSAEPDLYINDVDAYSTETNDTAECGVDEDLVILCRDVDTGFDMRVYESVFQTLDDTVDHPETTIANPEHDIELTLPSSLRNPDRRMQLSSCNNPGSLLIEHNIIAPFCQGPTQLNINMLIEFPFLDNFTKATGFISSFGCGTKQQRLSITLDPIRANPSENASPREEKMLNTATHWVEIARNMLVQGSGDTADPGVSLYVTHRIVDQIRKTAIKQHYCDSAGIHWSSSIEALCYDFFNPKNLDKCLALFWCCWYPNWPTIHAPTFKMVEKSPSLIAVMALVGACLSAEDRDHASAQLWFDLVEDLVYSDVAFDDQDISNIWKESTDTNRQNTNLQTLQAAYCVCLYQTWEGSKRSKRRVLRQRFNDLVYVSDRYH